MNYRHAQQNLSVNKPLSMHTNGWSTQIDSANEEIKSDGQVLSCALTRDRRPDVEDEWRGSEVKS